jgi:hypothetical protein
LFAAILDSLPKINEFETQGGYGGARLGGTHKRVFLSPVTRKRTTHVMLVQSINGALLFKTITFGVIDKETQIQPLLGNISSRSNQANIDIAP